MREAAKESNETEKPLKAMGSPERCTESLANLFEHYQGLYIPKDRCNDKILNSSFLFKGLVHMEALEMLSQQINSRVAPQIRRLAAQRRNAIEEIAQFCSRVSDSDESPDPDEFDLDSMEQSLTSYFDSISIQVALTKLMDVRKFFHFS